MCSMIGENSTEGTSKKGMIVCNLVTVIAVIGGKSGNLVSLCLISQIDVLEHTVFIFLLRCLQKHLCFVSYITTSATNSLFA